MILVTVIVVINPNNINIILFAIQFATFRSTYIIQDSFLYVFGYFLAGADRFMIVSRLEKYYLEILFGIVE